MRPVDTFCVMELSKTRADGCLVETIMPGLPPEVRERALCEEIVSCSFEGLYSSEQPWFKEVGNQRFRSRRHLQCQLLQQRN